MQCVYTKEYYTGAKINKLQETSIWKKLSNIMDEENKFPVIT